MYNLYIEIRKKKCRFSIILMVKSRNWDLKRIICFLTLVDFLVLRKRVAKEEKKCVIDLRGRRGRRIVFFRNLVTNYTVIKAPPTQKNM